MTRISRLLSTLFFIVFASIALGQADDIVVRSNPGGDDLAALQSAIDQGAQTGRQVVLDATAQPFRIGAPLQIRPIDNSGQVFLRLKCLNRTPGWPTIDYLGLGPAIKVYGLKNSLIDGLRVRTNTAGGSGFLISTNGSAQSTSGNIFSQCWVTAAATCPTGWLIGPDGAGAADISSNTFERCGVNSSGAFALVGVGFWVFGGNTLDLAFQGCIAYDIVNYAFRFEGNALYSPNTSGQGSVLNSCNVSRAAGFLRAAGGSRLTVTGGRTEHVSGAAIWAMAGGYQGDILVLGHCFSSGTKQSQADGATPVRFP